MTSISIEALKGKTIKEIRELIRQAESLPENQSPPLSNKLGVEGKDFLIDEELDVLSSFIPMGDAKPQTAQELLEEIENEK